MSTVASMEILAWQQRATVIRNDIAAARQVLRAHPGSGPEDPMRTGLDAAFDSMSTTLTLLHHLWVLADIQQ